MRLSLRAWISRACSSSVVGSQGFRIEHVLKEKGSIIRNMIHGLELNKQEIRAYLSEAIFKGLDLQGLLVRVQGTKYRVQGTGFRVQSPGFRVQG